MSLQSLELQRCKNYLDLVVNTLQLNQHRNPEVVKKTEQIVAALDGGTTSYTEFGAAISGLIAQADEPLYVWKMFSKLRLNHLLGRGQTPLYLISSPDLKVCLSEYVRLHSILFDTTYECRVTDAGGMIAVVFTDKHPSPVSSGIKADNAMALLLYIGREVIGDKFDFEQVNVPEEREISNTDAISEHSQAKVVRTKKSAYVLIKKSLLGEKNLYFNPAFYQQLRAGVNEQLALEEQPDSLTSRVTQILKNSERPASITIEQMAKALNMSDSSFRRHLANEDVSYKKLQNRFLDELCISELLNSEVKIDALALELGYAERSTFERSFRNKFAMTPSQLRDLSKQYTGSAVGGKDLKAIVSELPPLSNSCRDLLELANSNQLDLVAVVTILNTDPVFSGRVMGLASRAIYGNPPRDIRDAVGRSLGLETVKNLAVLYSAKDCLSNAIEGINVEHFINSMLVGPKLFQLFKRAMNADFEPESATLDQVMMFGLLGLFLLCNNAYTEHDFVKKQLSNAPNLNVFMQELAKKDISLLGATSLLLSFWGIDSSVIKLFALLEKHGTDFEDISKMDALILFTYDIVFCRVQGIGVTGEQIERAETLGIDDFEDLMMFLD